MIAETENQRPLPMARGRRDIADLFCGGGGSGSGILNAFDKLGIPVRGTFVNHWSEAIRIHDFNHPTHRHYLSGVEHIQPRKIYSPKQHLWYLWASPSCFAAGTLILSTRGLVPIETIKKGDYVLTHKGRWRKVTSTFVNNAPTVEVKGYGHYGLRTTEEHPFYSKRITTRYPTEKTPEGKRRRPGKLRTLVENPYWPEAKDMEGKLWATPHSFAPLPMPTDSGVEFSEAFFYCVGRWLGDGHCSKGDVLICCGKHETAELKDKLAGALFSAETGEPLSLREGHNPSTDNFAWGNQAFASWLADNFGALCDGKKLPAWCFSIQKSWRQALLQGYTDADGHETRRMEATSVSKARVLGMRLLAVSLGHVPSFFTNPGRLWAIEGRTGEGAQQWRAAWTVQLKRQTNFRDSLHLFTPVREVTKTGMMETVFNFEVEEDNSYVADGIVVHNCTHHSVARGGRPVSEQSRASGWCVVQWIRHKRPTHVTIENVKEYQDWGPLKQKSKGGKKLWTFKPTEDSKPVEVAEVPLKQLRDEPKHVWLKRLSDAGYEMCLEADKTKKGRIFKRWTREIRRMGYQVEYRVLCSADYGDPTTRRRLFVNCVRIDSGRHVTWPNPTHAKPDKEGNVPEGLRPWRTAAEIIDWSDEGESIFTRSRSLADKTLHRIAIGLIKYGLKDFLVPQHRGWDNENVRGVDEPVSTLTCNHRGEGIAQPQVVPLHAYHVPREGVRGNNQPAPLTEPLKTVIASHGCGSLAQPYLIPFFGERAGQEPRAGSIEEPAPTVTGQGAGAVVRPYITQMMGESTAQSADAPVTALVTGLKHGVVNPCLINMHGNLNTSTNSVDDPLRTVSAGGQHHGVLQAFVRAFQMATDHSKSTGRGTGCRPMDAPTMTSVTKNNQAVVNVSLNKLPPSIIHVANGISRAGEENRVKSPGEPLGTIHAGGGSFAVLQPNIIQIHGYSTTASADRTRGGMHHAPEHTNAGQPAGTHPGQAPRGDADRGSASVLRGHCGGQARPDHDDRNQAPGDHRGEEASRRTAPGSPGDQADASDTARATSTAGSSGDAARASSPAPVNESPCHTGPLGPVPESSAPRQPGGPESPAADHRAGPADAGHCAGGHGSQNNPGHRLARGGADDGDPGGVHRGAEGGYRDLPGGGCQDPSGGGLRIHLDETPGANHQGRRRVWGGPDDQREPGGADEARPSLRSALARVRSLAGAERPGVDAAQAGPADESQRPQEGCGDGFGQALPTGKLEPFIVGTAHAGDGRVRSILEPLVTVCGNRGDYGIVTPSIRPWVYTYYTSGSTGAGVDEPTPTVRTHDGIGLIVPELRQMPEGSREIQYPVLEINGAFFLLDLKFRMFQVRELARAQGFTDTTWSCICDGWQDASEYVKSAEQTSPPTRPTELGDPSSPAVVNAQINCVRKVLVLRSAGKSSSSANIVGGEREFPLPTHIADSALQLAATLSYEGKSIPTGKEGSPMSEFGFTCRRNGKLSERLCGSEIMRGASGAHGSTALSPCPRNGQSTTSRAGQSSQPSDSILTTLLSFVASAIDSCTPKPTRKRRSFILNFELTEQFEFPGTKTDAVKAIGNSVSCGVAEALTLANETQNPDISRYVGAKHP